MNKYKCTVQYKTEVRPTINILLFLNVFNFTSNEVITTSASVRAVEPVIYWLVGRSQTRYVNSITKVQDPSCQIWASEHHSSLDRRDASLFVPVRLFLLVTPNFRSVADDEVAGAVPSSGAKSKIGERLKSSFNRSTTSCQG